MKIILLLLSIMIFLPAQYLITDSTALLNNGANYLIVTHANFTNQLYPLCRLRDTLDHLIVKMVEVNLIYSTFPDTSLAYSIRKCMQRVYYYWNPRPTYILLVGDAQRGGGANDYIPCKVFPKFNYSYWGGITQHATDNWYVTLEGNDSIPDMIIARLPVNSATMTQNVVNKIVRYETRDTFGIWQRTVLVNSSTDRESHAQGFVNSFLYPAGDSVIKIYESQGNTPSLRQRHIQAINQGVYMILPVCHGTQPPAWVGMSYTLFHNSDISSLNNQVYPVSFGRG